MAAKAGVDRLELCSSYSEGGETPGPGFFSYIKQRVNIPVFVMIRPRGGDFVYSTDEIHVMKEEIRQFYSLGADGFVFGVLQEDGSVDRDACTTLVHLAENKPCTFHRAFDMCKNRVESCETIIRCGFKRILTSGGKNSVEEGLNEIIRILNLAQDRIIVMPGGGLKPGHLKALAETGNLREIHASCKKVRSTPKRYKNPDVTISANESYQDGVLSFNSAVYGAFRDIIHSLDPISG